MGCGPLVKKVAHPWGREIYIERERETETERDREGERNTKNYLL
jgi:hypothetical protein